MPRFSLGRMLRVAALLALGPLAAGCTGLGALQKASVPTDLYDLTPKSTFDADLPSINAQLVVEEPTAAAGVNTDRIAVKPDAFAVEYFPDARWVDRAPLLVQTLLVESFENTDKVRSVGRRAIGLYSDYTLLTDLREFQAEVSNDKDPTAPLQVQVQLNLKIIKEPEGLIVASQNFGRELPVASDNMPDVIEAFDDALGKSMRGAVEWAVREIGRLEKGRPPRIY